MAENNLYTGNWATFPKLQKVQRWVHLENMKYRKLISNIERQLFFLESLTTHAALNAKLNNRCIRRLLNFLKGAMESWKAHRSRSHGKPSKDTVLDHLEGRNLRYDEGLENTTLTWKPSEVWGNHFFEDKLKFEAIIASIFQNKYSGYTMKIIIWCNEENRPGSTFKTQF